MWEKREEKIIIEFGCSRWGGVGDLHLSGRNGAALVSYCLCPPSGGQRKGGSLVPESGGESRRRLSLLAGRVLRLQSQDPRRRILTIPALEWRRLRKQLYTRLSLRIFSPASKRSLSCSSQSLTALHFPSH